MHAPVGDTIANYTPQNEVFLHYKSQMQVAWQGVSKIKPRQVVIILCKLIHQGDAGDQIMALYLSQQTFI